MVVSNIIIKEMVVVDSEIITHLATTIVSEVQNQEMVVLDSNNINMADSSVDTITLKVVAIGVGIVNH